MVHRDFSKCRCLGPSGWHPAGAYFVLVLWPLAGGTPLGATSFLGVHRHPSADLFVRYRSYTSMMGCVPVAVKDSAVLLRTRSS